ncbi:MAG TPA: hypothetical protein VK402_15225 [Blastococcus sp.]|nr:hypothetical protein [Blastococcus sp.]
MSRTPVRLLVLALTAAIATFVLPATAHAAPYCGITWGSLDKQTASLPAGGDPLVNVRAGRNTCYDRLVLDVRGAVQSWHVRYVSGVTNDPVGNPVPLRGGAFLEIVAGAQDHDAAGRQTYDLSDRPELVNVTGFTTFRQVAGAGSFEGVSSIGLGVRARLPFRVFTLAGIPGSSSGTRLVIDVAHRW